MMDGMTASETPAGSADTSGSAVESPTEGSVPAPAAPPAAATVFGDRLPLAERYAAHLADTGISHGLVGPREVPRLWERHILNCAVVAEVMALEARVIDVGSGAGLPGLCIALARPDLSITLVEPMERRTAWLEMVVADLGLDAVTVRRARAEEVHGELEVDIVTARAVAALDKLARWCLPLVRPGGRLVAMKGSSAEREITEARTVLRRLHATDASVRVCGADVLEVPTTVVVVEKSADVPASASPASSTPASRSQRSRGRTGAKRSARRSRRGTPPSGRRGGGSGSAAAD